MQRHINPPVFYGSTAIIAALVILCAVAPHRAEIGFDALQAWVLGQFGWFYILSVSIYLGVALILGLGRFGRLKLGPDDAVPDYPFASWLAMLFAAGMGIGLMFFAVGEPMTHFAAPPEAVARTIAAEREAMQVTFFHWGLHAWGIYAVVGLSLAYFGYRYNLPLTIRSGLYPLLKERINGPIGNAVDIFAICGTLFGLATSLGLGVLQINSGLNYLTGIPVSVGVQVGLIALITAVASVSVVTGLDKGVRRLSELNLLLALVLMIFVLAVGPTTLLLKSFVQNIGLYLDDILLRSFNIYAYEPRTWIDSWTLFYWAWWISWSPFVGMFIARISRGRTVREFVLAVLFIPAGFTFLWMTVFGNSAFFVDTTMANGALATAVAEDVSVGLFQFFQYLPMPAVTSTLAVMLVAVFFVTSSDSGSLVVDTIAAGGAPTTPVAQRLFWCSLEGIVAAVLLIAGGLSALQTATIASALPFAIIILVLCWGLFKGMSADLAGTRAGVGVPAAHPAAGVPWQKRLGLILHAPDEADVRRFIDATAVPALEAVAGELISSGREATVSRDADGVGVSLVVTSVDVRNFVYGVQHATEKLPVFSTIDPSQEERRHEARTAFSDGSRGYDVMGFDKDHLIGDVLVQFERYLALVHSPHSQLFLRSPEAMAE